ncbi:MAG: acyl-CoA dehydrogenase [Acidimicrobiales bacterium]|nr:acyl-CoA dehydrogenase [Hyphomonadaceae bacterium]RZV40777.1 MAG: acyl-CoA dehydrogenase [Acidimicrobiales bacterium]
MSDPVQKVRDEFGTWMKENLAGEFACLKWRGTFGDDEAYPELRQKWEQKLGADGWVGVGWPKKYGGRGYSLPEMVAYNEEYARYGGPGRSGHIGETLFGPTVIAFGTEEQKKQFLPGIRAGTEYWCQGYSEPNAGSDLSNIKTKARLVGDEWVVDGQKIWTSLAVDADWVFVIARAEEGSKGRNGLVFLLVPLDQPGVEIRPITQITGGSEFNELFFTEAKTAKGNILGGVGDGWKIAMALLGFERGASTLGQQMIFANEVNEIIKLAKINGAYHDPHIRQRIAKAYAGLKIMRFSALRMLSGAEKGEWGPETYTSKIYWATWHRDLGELAMDVVGSEAEIMKDGEFGALQKMFLFSRADTIYAGTNQIQRNMIAERALGMPKEPRGDPNA